MKGGIEGGNAANAIGLLTMKDERTRNEESRMVPDWVDGVLGGIRGTGGDGMRLDILSTILRKFTDKGVSIGLAPKESKALLVWCFDLKPLEWDCWRN